MLTWRSAMTVWKINQLASRETRKQVMLSKMKITNNHNVVIIILLLLL